MWSVGHDKKKKEEEEENGGGGGEEEEQEKGKEERCYKGLYIVVLKVTCIACDFGILCM